MALTPRLSNVMAPRRNAGWLPERDVFETIQDLMHRPFDDFFGSSEFMPRVDVSEQDQETIVRAEIPGMSPENVDVKLENGNLVLKGEKKVENEDKDENRYHVERSFGSFYRAIPVSSDVTEEDVKASFKNGVLTVRLPNSKVKAQGKRIPIESE